MQPMSLSAYGRRRGVSAEAVSKAVEAGRLDRSVVRDQHGAPKIADPELADREWAANTRAQIDRTAAPVSTTQPTAPADPLSAAAPRAAGTPDLNTSRALRAAAAARREAAEAERAELEVAARKGQLVAVDQARADVIAAYSVVKTRLLAVPSRVAQRLPDVAARVVPVVDELIREALEELAADDGADHGDA